MLFPWCSFDITRAVYVYLCLVFFAVTLFSFLFLDLSNKERKQERKLLSLGSFAESWKVVILHN